MALTPRSYAPVPRRLGRLAVRPATMEDASGAEKKLPPWIDSLISSTFFDRCRSHPQWYGTNRRCPAKDGCNILCIDCCIAVCSRCTQEEHHGHRAIQIRVSSFQNVVRVADIKPFLDVAHVHKYFINGFPVVCINRRPKATGRWPGSGNGMDAGSSTCKVCSRVLRGVCTFCSIECKICYYASSAAQLLSPEATITVSKATEMPMMSGARKRARKATPQRAHLGCTL